MCRPWLCWAEATGHLRSTLKPATGSDRWAAPGVSLASQNGGRGVEARGQSCRGELGSDPIGPAQ